MATLSNKLAITNLSQLIRSRQPLEILVAERNQEDNLDVLNYVNTFMDVVDAELKMPTTYKAYVYGQKEQFVRNSMIARLELVASRIEEKKVSVTSTLDIDELNFFTEELDFFVDLYFLLVTTMIDLTAIRKTDLDSSTAYSEVYDIIEIHLLKLGDYSELKELLNELDARKDAYPGHPKLEERIDNLIRIFPLEEGDFIFNPAQSISDYSTGDVLISINPNSSVVGIEVGDLPAGIELDEETGDVFIADLAALQAGDYDVVLKTSDEMGGQTTHHLELPIGVVGIPQYEIAPAKVIQAYLAGDVLARLVVNPDSFPVKKAEWTDLEKYPTPPGVTLNESSGEVTVQDEDFLSVGVFDLRIILTSDKGIQSKHEFSLSFKQDSKAVYSLSPSKSIKELKQGDILATVSDADAKIIGASKNSLPSGTAIDTTGSLIVSDPTKLVRGTYLFNVISTDSSSVESLKTLFITLKDADNPFYYDTTNLSPIDELNAGDVIAELLSTPSTPVSKVSLIRGSMPKGTIVDSSGNISVEAPDLLEVGNYDLRFKVYVLGINLTTLEAANSLLATNEQSLIDQELLLESLQAQKLAAELSLNEYKSSFGFQKKQLEDELEKIGEQLATATGDALQQLQILKSQKVLELSVFEGLALAEMNTRTAEINAFTTDIDALILTIAQLKSDIEILKLNILKLRSDRWIEYEASVLLTFEKDNPSAWHVEIPKDWDEYTDNEVIAQLIDSDGYDGVKLDPAGQTMPPGLNLNTALGVVEVSDHNLLQPGEYVITTKSKDKQKGISNHRLAIIIGGDATGQEEDFVMLPKKPANNYINEEILGYPVNPLYAILSARVTQGLLPLGVAVDPETGAIYVEDADKLQAGLYDGIVIKTNNSSGGVFYHDISLSFVTTTLFDVGVAPSKPLSAYKLGDPIIGVTVTKGLLKGIQVVSGTLASGLGINSSSGKIFVAATNELKEGDYQVELYMAETNGASDQQTVDYTIGGGTKAVVVWAVTTPIDKTTVATNTVCATPSLLNRTIVSAKLTSIPKGFQSISKNGEIRVGSPQELVVGSSTFNIELTDDLGEVYFELVVIEVTQSTVNNTVITAIVTPGREFHVIKNGDLLSRLDPEKEVKSATIASGEIPVGSELNGVNGQIVVIDRYGLSRGIKTADLSVQTGTTVAGTSSVTSNAVATSAAGGAAQLVTVTIGNKVIPNFSNVAASNKFLAQMINRLENFNTAFMSDTKVADKLLSSYDKALNMASWLSGVLTSSDNLLRIGEFDAQMFNSYTASGTSIITAFQQESDPVIRELIADIYNEMYTTQLAILTYRDKDIIDSTKTPSVMIIQAMKGHLAALQTGVDIDYMRNNAKIILERIPTGMPILKSRFSILVV